MDTNQTIITIDTSEDINPSTKCSFCGWSCDCEGSPFVVFLKVSFLICCGLFGIGLIVMYIFNYIHPIDY